MMRITAALLVCLGLAGCATVPGVTSVHYTLTPTSPAQAQAATAALQATLRLGRIEVPAWLAGTGMAYRLLYRNQRVIAAYARSDWAAPPAELLHALLQRRLAASGAWRAVLGPHAAARADYGVRIRLDDFSQAFATPRQSVGVLDATATLVATRDDTVLAQHRFNVRVAAATPDAAGGVAALDTAGNRFATRLDAWLAGVVARRASRG